MKATCFFQHNPEWRTRLFAGGLRAAGIEHVPNLQPSRGNLLVIWNRQGESHTRAKAFESAGGHVIVVENGYLGVNWRDSRWFAMAHNHHNGVGVWPGGSTDRWDSWGVELAPWRKPGGECVILAQRGIGEYHLRAPDDWLTRAVGATRGRIRRHPGTDKNAVPLETDLERASSVATWSSGAALKALLMGIPVFYGMPRWIGASASRPLDAFNRGPFTDSSMRLDMFRRLAWAMWSETEILNGLAFGTLMKGKT